MIGCMVPGCSCTHVRAPADPVEVDTVVIRQDPAPGLTRAEQVAVAIRLTEKGHSAREIARVVGRTPRTIVRWRTAIKEATS